MVPVRAALPKPWLETHHNAQDKRPEFCDVFNDTLARMQAKQDVSILLTSTFDEAASLLLTHGLNFSGAPADLHASDAAIHPK